MRFAPDHAAGGYLIQGYDEIGPHAKSRSAELISAASRQGRVSLLEPEAYEVCCEYGIRVPPYKVMDSIEEAVSAAGEIGYPVVAQAQVLVGSRGLAGGIKIASGQEELREIVRSLLGTEIRGLPVRKILVAEKAGIAKELYAGITVDGYSGKPVIVASTEGGVHIEKTAQSGHEKIANIQTDPLQPFNPNQARALLEKFGLNQNLLLAWADVIAKLYQTFIGFEALIAEINPLVILSNNELLAVDAVLELDNSALLRLKQPLPDKMERIENPLERKGREIGVTLRQPADAA